jgi:hypothetical protein
LPGDAPTDSWIPISFWHGTPARAAGFAALAQPIISASPNTTKIGAIWPLNDTARACRGSASA